MNDTPFTTVCRLHQLSVTDIILLTIMRGSDEHVHN